MLDTIAAGIIWSRFVSAADEMVSALVRTSFSTMVRESGDYSCMLFDARGRLLAQGSASVPSFTGTGPATLAAMLQVYPADTLAEGDVLVTNDPWLGTGHVYDINIAKPIFHRGKLVAFALSVSHLADIGGIGYGTGAHDVYEEGLCIPVTKLFRAGQENDDLLRLIRSNVRFETLVIGDIFSNVSACNVAARVLREILDEYQLPHFLEVADMIFELTRSAVKSALAQLPHGTHRGELMVEALTGGEDIRLSVAASLDENGIRCDFEGTSPTRAWGINVPACYTRAFCVFAFKSLVAPTIPNNQGILDFVQLTAPAGCILNAQRPAATGGRHVLGHYVASLLFGALADAAPDRVQADSGMVCQVSLRSLGGAGRDFFTVFYSTGGYGAFADLDGRSALPGPSNMIGMSVEVWEQTTGITMLEKRLLPDSGGAGRHQGGCGQLIALRNDSGGPLSATFFGARTRIGARGFNGGCEGALRSIEVDGRVVSAASRMELPPGAVVVLREAGGGGFGPPSQRDAAAIRKDLADGLITRAYARTHYPEQMRAIEGGDR